MLGVCIAYSACASGLYRQPTYPGLTVPTRRRSTFLIAHDRLSAHPALLDGIAAIHVLRGPALAIFVLGSSRDSAPDSEAIQSKGRKIDSLVNTYRMIDRPRPRGYSTVNRYR